MRTDPAARIAQGISIAITTLLAVLVVSWHPHLAPARLPVSAPADVELTVEATPAPPELPQPALAPSEPSPPAPPPPPKPSPHEPPPSEPPPPEPPLPEPPPPEPPPPEPLPIITPPTAPAAPRALPTPRVQPPRVPRAVSRPPFVQTQPSSPPNLATPHPAATAATAAPVSSASADSSYTGSIRAIIDRRNVPPDTAEYRLLHPHGTAEIGYTIARNGAVSGVRLVHSSGSPILDRQALANVAAGGYPSMSEAAFAGQAQHSFTIRITFNSSSNYDP